MNENQQQQTPDATASDVDRQFDALTQQYYHAWLRFHPEDAVDVGVNDYADQLRSYEHDDIGALVALNQKMQSALEELSFDRLDANRKVDYTLIKGAISIELHNIQAHDWRYTNPMAYVPVNAIYQLLIHPGKNFHQAIKHRLALIPEYLRGARVMLQQSPQTVVPNWLHTAEQMCESGAVFIRGLVRHSLMASKFANPARLQPLLDDAANALLGFAAFLKTEIEPHAAGDFAVGEDDFNRLLKEKHFLDADASAILAYGERLFAETEDALKALTRKVRGNEDVQAWLAQIQARHPAKEALLDEYRQRLRNTYKWLQAENIVSIPAKQSLSIQQTPAFLTEVIPFAAYEPPMPGDSEQRGIYYVTTVENDALLAEHNEFSIDLTCVHEAFPGHHLQFVAANRFYGDDVTRLLNASATLFEGWALYCEDLSVELGLLDQDEHHFMMLRDRLWRALRIILDVKLQTRQMGLVEASDLMVEKLGFDRKQAIAEVNWYSSAPATPLCYAVGRALILQLKQQVGDAEGLKTFHDKLLSQGSIALPLVIKRVFGDAYWQCVHDTVFE